MFKYAYKWVTKYEDFLFKRNDKDDGFLLFFRVSVSLICLVHFCAIWYDFDLLYRQNGIVPSEVVALFKQAWIPSFGQIENWLNHTFEIRGQDAVSLFKTTFVCTCLSLACGFMTRPCAILLLFLHLILIKGSDLYSYGIDNFKTIVLFYCCIFPVGKQFAVDNVVFGRNTILHPTPYRRILQIHLCLVYFFSGLEKLMGYNWHNGESIWKALHLPFFSTDLSFHIDSLSAYPLVFIILGWGVILIELGYPFFMYYQKTRTLWLILTVLLHLGILLGLSLYFFSALMIILNIAAFMDMRITPKSSKVMSHRGTTMNKKYALQKEGVLLTK